jgi:hypothetical protein
MSSSRTYTHTTRCVVAANVEGSKSRLLDMHALSPRSAIVELWFDEGERRSKNRVLRLASAHNATPMRCVDGQTHPYRPFTMMTLSSLTSPSSKLSKCAISSSSFWLTATTESLPFLFSVTLTQTRCVHKDQGVFSWCSRGSLFALVSSSCFKYVKAMRSH